MTTLDKLPALLVIFKHNFLKCCALIILSQNVCCTNYSGNNNVSLDEILRVADSLKEKNVKAAMMKVDSLYLLRKYNVIDHYKILNWKRDLFFSSIKDYNSAMKFADSSLFIIKSLINDSLYAHYYAKSLFLKGDIFFEQNKIMDGIYYYSLAREFIGQKLKNICELVGYNGRIGNILFKQRKYKEAVRFFLQECKERVRCETDSFARFVYIQLNLDNIGMSYMNAGLADSATYYFDSALAFISKNEVLFPKNENFVRLARAVVFSNKAELLSFSNRYYGAEALFLQSLKTTKKSDPTFYQSSAIKLASVYCKTKQLTKASQLLTEIQLTFDSTTSQNNLMEWYKLKSEILASDNSGAALRYLKTYIEIKERLANSQQDFFSLDLITEFQRGQEAASKFLLSQNEKITSLYSYFIILFCVLFSVVLLSGFKFKMWLKRLKHHEAFSRFQQKRYLKGIAHDLKNPISAINNLAHSLLKKPIFQPHQETLEIIQSACIDASSLIKQMLIETNQSTDNALISSDARYIPKYVNLTELLHFTAELLQANASEKEQHINIEAADDAYICIDQLKMWRVLTNLLTNAIKFSYPNNDINVRIQKQGCFLLVSVEDFGIGIPPNVKKDIFSNGSLFSRIGTSGEESHGLGLSICKNIIEEAGGTIWFESELGRGSIFYFQLPIIEKNNT